MIDPSADQTNTDDPPPETEAGATRSIPVRGEVETLDSSRATFKSTTQDLHGRFGRYEIVRLLGRGGMGAVYLARDTLLDREVAIKIPTLDGAVDHSMVERFYREARAAAKLSHPNLCAVYDVGEIDGSLFLAMPFIRGESLSALIKSHGALPAKEAANLVQKLASALEVAHEAGILHRDLKPSNVMLDHRGEPIIMDFGLARLEHQEDVKLTVSGTFLGTPAYASPEQLTGDLNSLTSAADIYSLGVLLFEALTGRLPFIGPLAAVMKQVLVDPPPIASSLNPSTPPALDRVCSRALAKRPGERYPSMSAMAAALAEIDWQHSLDTTEVVEAVTIGSLVAELRPSLIGVPAIEANSTQPNRSTVVETNSTTATVATPAVSARRIFGGCGIVSVLLLVGCVGLCSVAYYSIPSFLKDIVANLDVDTTNWDDLANFWTAPPDDQMPPDFSQIPLQSGTFTRQEDVESLAEFDIKLPGRRALFRDSKGDIEVFALRASNFEKEAVYEKVAKVISQHDRDKKNQFGQSHFDEERDNSLPDYPHYETHLRTGGPAQHFYHYRHRNGFGKFEDSGIFWWDEGWMFVVRTKTDTDPKPFLRDLLAKINREVKTSPEE